LRVALADWSQGLEAALAARGEAQGPIRAAIATDVLHDATSGFERHGLVLLSGFLNEADAEALEVRDGRPASESLGPVELVVRRIERLLAARPRVGGLYVSGDLRHQQNVVRACDWQEQARRWNVQGDGECNRLRE
jgi:hypothetical protein